MGKKKQQVALLALIAMVLNLFLPVLPVMAELPPPLSLMQPYPGMTNVPVDTRIEISAYGKLNPDTVNANTVFLQVYDNPGETVYGKAYVTADVYNVNNDRINFIPDFPLKPNTTYLVKVTSNVESASGIPVQPAEWQFTTGSPPPHVVWSSVQPPAGRGNQA